MGWPDIARIVIRVWGVFIAANATLSFTLQLMDFFAFDVIRRQEATSLGAYAGMIALYFLQPMIFLGLGAALIFLAPRLVRRFSRIPLPEETELDLQAIERVFISVLGLYFIADGMTYMAHVAFNLAAHVFNPPQGSFPLEGVLAFLFRMAVLVTIGMVLILRNEGVRALIHRFVGGVRQLRHWPH